MNGQVYHTTKENINEIFATSTVVVIFKNSVDGLYYAKLPGGAIELIANPPATGDIETNLITELTVGAGVKIGSLQKSLIAKAIIAKVGGGQDAAAPLAATYNRIETVATIDDSVTAFDAKEGAEVTVINSSDKAMNLFPFTANKIDGQANNAPLGIPSGSNIKMICFTDGEWDLV